MYSIRRDQTVFDWIIDFKQQILALTTSEKIYIFIVIEIDLQEKYL